ncbi:hypothetical protein TWF679_004254 [Orbilia oligospora]|uniref:Uncharacterized protein n=1 Tax=Orbilia oligospora TaxID=2813651 RepID=A0A8H8VME0_ORBOL|nr:hypothetical protein TWF679_004254 [Orbilia oligospora]
MPKSLHPFKFDPQQLDSMEKTFIAIVKPEFSDFPFSVNYLPGGRGIRSAVAREIEVKLPPGNDFADEELKILAVALIFEGIKHGVFPFPEPEMFVFCRSYTIEGDYAVPMGYNEIGISLA